jgi:hypothetical protein
MTAVDWILTGTLALSIVPVIEAVKWLARGGRLGALA